MSRVRSSHTAPEMIVRRLLHSMGYRYRLHRKSLPGKPDIVFPSLHTAVFVHGCFWHAHGCNIGQLPKSHLDFWQEKFRHNRERDVRNQAALESTGWRVLTIWQCETKDMETLRGKLRQFLVNVRTASA